MRCLIRIYTVCYFNYFYFHFFNPLHSGGPLLYTFYCKDSKYWDTLIYYCKYLKNETFWFYNAGICRNYADRMANSVDPDQTALKGAVWSGSALFAHIYLSQYMYLEFLPYMLDETICHFKGVRTILLLLFYFWWKILLANNVDPDQMPRYVASDLVLQCLAMTFSQVSK